MAINRDEFDRLVARVDRLELGQHATIELVASEIVGLRTYVEEGFAAIDRRFDARMGGFEIRMDGFDARMDGFDARMDRFEHKLDLHTEQVNVAIRVGSEAVAENRRVNDAIIQHLGLIHEHLGVEGPEG
jgi:hypothetical protein